MALASPIAQADDDPMNALMMGGTTAPTPSEFWQDTIVTDYSNPATGADCTPVNSAEMPTPTAHRGQLARECFVWRQYQKTIWGTPWCEWRCSGDRIGDARES